MLIGAEIRIGNSRENNGSGNSLCATIQSIKAGEAKVFQCDKPIKGRYVNVHLPWDRKEKQLVLCEVEICGRKKDSPLVLVKKNKTWEKAVDYCRRHYQDLASIPTDDSQVWAELEAREANSALVWLGLRYTCTLDFWFWVSNKCFGYDNWAPGNGSREEECDMSGAMERGGEHRWVSQPDTNKFNFICEQKEKKKKMMT
ncbi:uncharacterized protein LOC139916206 [Centroberyx gerrardi]